MLMFEVLPGVRDIPRAMESSPIRPTGVVYSMPNAVYRKMLRPEWLKKKKLVFMKRFLLYVLFKGVYGGVCRVETGAFGAHFTPCGADSAERKGI